MKNLDEDELQKQFDAAKACLERSCPAKEGTRRASVVSSAVHTLADYRAYLSELERTGNGAIGCGVLRNQLSERAFAVEGDLRILLAEGLNSLNDLRDSGMLYVSLATFSQALEGGKIDFRA